MYSLPSARMFLVPILAVALMPAVVLAQVDVPAATAYLEPDDSRVKVSPNGISQWTDPAVRIKWYGQLKASRPIECLGADQTDGRR